MEFSEGTRTFGVRFYEDEDKAESYQFVFNVTENRYVFEKKPNWPWPANQNIGLERPIDLIPGKKYNIRMIVDDTIATIYVDGVALNARAYKRPGESLSLFASEGSMKITNCKVTTGLKSFSAAEKSLVEVKLPPGSDKFWYSSLLLFLISSLYDFIHMLCSFKANSLFI